MRRGACLVLVLVFALAACDKQPSTSEQDQGRGEVSKDVAALRAPHATLPDQPFEDLMGTFDFANAYGARADSIVDQIRRTRAAVELQTTNRASQGPRRDLVSFRAAVGNFSFAQFAFNFGYVLDELTRKSGSLSMPSNPFSSTESGNDTSTTTTLSVTETFSGSGSVVTATVRWSYSTITIDTSPNGGGATIFHLTDDRDFTGTIDVCPDSAGGVPTTLVVSSQVTAESSGTTTRRSSNGQSSFRGNVNNSAALTNVTQQSKVENSSESVAGSGGSTSETSATWNPSSSGSFSDLDIGSFTAKIEAKGVTSAAEAAKAAGWDAALGMFAVEPAYLAARELWQHGRCVVVAVPEWSAETPIQVHEQQKSQHTEEVDVSSDTKFSVQLEHRFAGGALNKPTTADLTDGKEKLSPNKLDSGGGQLTYKAGDEDDKEATALLKSTSNRGIGTLVLTFRTAGTSLTLNVQGVQELGPPGATLRSNISIGPAKFARKDDKSWEATAPFSATSSLVPPNKDCPNLTITQSGTMVLTATIDTRGDQRFWVVRYGAGGSSQAVGSGCDEDVTQSLAVGGGFGSGLFLGNVGDIVIPIDGGTVSLSGSRGTGRSSGTATATVTKKN